MRTKKEPVKLPDYRHELVTINVGLARMCANKWVRKTGRTDLADDVLQECIAKLIDAAIWYATPLGIRFSTYAVTSIERNLYKIVERMEKGGRIKGYQRSHQGDGDEFTTMMDGIPAKESEPFRQVEAEEQVNAVMVFVSTADRRTLEEAYLREIPLSVVAWSEGVTKGAIQKKRKCALRRVHRTVAAMNETI